MKAKEVSLWAIIAAIVWVAILTLAKAFVPVIWVGRELGLDMMAIFVSGGFFVVACTPVYRSIWLDKTLGISSGGGQPETEAKTGAGESDV